MKNYLFTLIVVFLLGQAALAQPAYQYHIVANTNLYVPGQESNKGVYPIIGYDEDADPKVLVGGFGVGMSISRSMGKPLRLKGQINLSKHTYWDEPLDLRGVDNEPHGTFVSGSSDYALGLTLTPHYLLTEKLSLGTGFGAQLFTLTASRLMKLNRISPKMAFSRPYKQFLLMLPVELSWTGKKMLYNLRYEYGLTNRYKAGLADYKSDRFGLVYFEVGFRL